MALTFIISDESLNRYGYRILTKGIDLNNFKKNPIALYNHQRPGWDNRDIKPVGRWENIRKEDGKLLADFVPSEATEEAREVKILVEDGTLRTCSLNVELIKTSDAVEDLMPGQYRPTVTACELIEISITDIPGNPNAVRLSHSSEGELDNILPKLSLNLNTKPKMENLFKLLGATDEASALRLVAELQKDKSQLAEAQNRIAQLEAAQKDGLALSLVEGAIGEGRLLPGQKDAFLAMAKNDPEGVKAILLTMPPRERLSNRIKPDEHSDATLTDAQTYKQKWEEGKLKQWQKSDPEAYNRCKLAWENSL